MSPPEVRAIERRVRWACYLALLALGMIVWALVHPAPLPVIGAMSVGQLFGTLSLAFFVYAIIADLRPALLRVRARAMHTTGENEPPPSPGEPEP